MTVQITVLAPLDPQQQPANRLRGVSAMAAKTNEPSEQALLEEYKLCESIVQHLDRINASNQSIFLAGSRI
jgi:hypothetical protein